LQTYSNKEVSATGQDCAAVNLNFYDHTSPYLQPSVHKNDCNNDNDDDNDDDDDYDDDIY
jgi:hypothetical protein